MNGILYENMTVCDPTKPLKVTTIGCRLPAPFAMEDTTQLDDVHTVLGDPVPPLREVYAYSLPKLDPTTVIDVWPSASGPLPTFAGCIEDIVKVLYENLKKDVVTKPKEAVISCEVRKPSGILHTVADQDVQNVDCESLGEMRALLECLSGPKFDPKIKTRADPVTASLCKLIFEKLGTFNCSGEMEYG